MAIASTPTVAAGGKEFGLQTTIYTNRKNTTYTHTLDALLYTGSKIIESEIAQNVGASAAWVPPLELMQHIPNATSARARIRCRTYDSVGSFVGYAFSDYFDLAVPAAAAPTISSFTATPIGNGVPAAWGLYIKGYSQPHFRISAAGKYGATIKSYIIRQTSTTGPRIPPLYDPDIESGVLTQAGTCTLKATVTDSRGLTATKTLTLEVVDYEPPRISDAKFERCLADGTPDDDGTYLKVYAKLSISPCKGKNSYTATVQYRIKGASTWQTAGNYETAATKIYNIRMTDSIYEVRIALQDGIQTSYAGATLDIGTILYEYDPTGNELKFKVPVAFASGPDYVVDSGTSGSWRYQKWASGLVELWGAHQVKASSSTAIGNGYYSSQFSIALPFGMTGAVVSGTASNICHICNADVEGQVVVFRLSNYSGISTTTQYTARLHIKGVLA